jgi:hypothetical protein
MADWEGFDLSQIIENSATSGLKIGDTIKATAQTIETVSSILDILKTFFQATSDPRLAAVKGILNQLQQTLDNLQNSGVYALFMSPNSLDDLAENYQGGYGKFEAEFLNSLYDTQDSQRPQIDQSGSLGGLFLYVGAGTGRELLSKLNNLAQAFSRSFKISYPAPVNFQIHPANAEGVPQDKALIDAFVGDDEPDSLAFEWEEPRAANDVFLDLFADNKFYIEKSRVLQGDPIKNDEVPKDRENPLEKRARKDGDALQLTGSKSDRTSGAELRVWEPLDENDPFVLPNENTGPGISNNSLAGTYSYHLEDVDKGIENGRYYRVRSVPDDVILDEIEGKKTLVRNGLPYEGSYPCVPKWGALPDVDYDFDLPTALVNIYRVAYAFRMDRAIYDDQGQLLTGSSTLERPIPPAVFQRESYVGQTVGTYDFQDRDGFSESVFWLKRGMFPAGNVSDFDKTNRELKEDLLVDPAKFDAFGGVDEFVAPSANLDINERFRLSADRLVEERVEKLVPIISENDTLFQLFQQTYQGIESDLDQIMRDGLTEGEFLGSDIRGEIATLLRIMERNTEQGVPPNWESINFFDELFGIASTIDGSLQGVLDDITESIDGIQDRLEKLTAIIAVIEDLIDFLNQLKSILDIDVKVLWVPPKSGGTGYFVQEFLDAGDKPDTESNDFYSAIVLAMGGQSPADFEAQAKAIKLLLGV